MAISAIQIWTCPAFSLVPTNVLILRCCFKALEEQFNLPPFLVDGGNRTGGDRHEVGQKGEPSVLLLIPDDHLPQEHRASVLRMGTDQTLLWLINSESQRYGLVNPED